jgi:hypothetical protein
MRVVCDETKPHVQKWLWLTNPAKLLEKEKIG